MLKKLGKRGSGIEILKEKYVRYKTINWIEAQYAKLDAAAEKGNLMIDGKRVPKYVGDKVELYEFEKRNIVGKGIGVGSDGKLYISKEALEHFKKVEKGGQSGLKKGEKGANDNIIKPYTGPSTGYKSKVGGKVEIGSKAGYGYKHVTALDTSLLEKTISFSDTQIQAKFKHAGYFGIKGPYNKGNAGMFKNKLIEHIKNPDTIAIAGKYHVRDVVHYYNPKTNINVMKGTDGQFISGWKLEGRQPDYMKSSSKIGGS